MKPYYPLYFLALSCVPAFPTEYHCDLFMDRLEHPPICARRLQDHLDFLSRDVFNLHSSKYLGAPALSRCMARKTVYFAGSSHTRAMLLPFVERMTGHRQDPNLASRHKPCANLDGLDLTHCGWPYSRSWTFDRRGRLRHEQTFTSPPLSFEPLDLFRQDWRFVFQFKTFVSTPGLDQEILRQLEEYEADLLVLEVGVWGWLPAHQDLANHTRTLLDTLRTGFDGTIIMIVDGFNYGPVGPHVVNGSAVAPVLKRVARQYGDVLVFDRTPSLIEASQLSYLRGSMEKHGYAGLVADAHLTSLLYFVCRHCQTYQRGERGFHEEAG